MKFIKKSLLALSLLTVSATILPGNGWGGGFAAGALTGVAVTSIATSAARNNNGESSASVIGKQIKETRMEKKRVTRDYKKGNITKEDHDQQQKNLDDQIRNLQSQL